MSTGFEVVNDNGSKQVLDKAPLFVFRDKLDHNNPNGSGRQYGQFSNKHVFATRPYDGHTLLTKQGGAFYWLDDPVDNEPYAHVGIGQGEVIRFDYNIPANSTDNYGLEVFGESGSLVYTSNQKALKILDVVKFSDIRPELTTVNGRNTCWSKNYIGKNVAALTIQFPAWNKNSDLMTIALAKRGDTYALEAAVEVSNDSNGDIVPAWGLYVLIIDVTGY
ncbi:hypothetical protein [Psychrobacter sp. 72-O-c]|uniref:hypothetical protein n=1 Tax=Psychrobacter sp. 72-O-c TaxID=2774125 RepID=UPI00191B38A9|nr:hypothetical protein [Psychrobacter sp. 72-O-c]